MVTTSKNRVDVVKCEWILNQADLTELADLPIAKKEKVMYFY